MALIPTDAAPTIAALSLCVSVLTGLLGVAAFRKGGPKVRTRCYAVRGSGEQPAQLVLDVTNRGRSEVTINLIDVYMSSPWSDKKDIENSYMPQFDAEFPYRLPANASVQWTCPAERVANFRGGLESKCLLRLTIAGRRRNLRILPPAPHRTAPQTALPPLS
ncbi:hypothetical protein [Streptomyces sp. NPDC101115]|uniref:hypothetical protein n=1 Tax=Streptomyces sp. NPDC101115 TaxID=3366106 RepID=UPI0037F7E6AA